MKIFKIIPFLVLLTFLVCVPSFAQNTSTDESEVRNNVLKKVEEALKSPKAYLGSVTDITESTIQIKTVPGEIKQISVRENASVVKVSRTQTSVKVEDIALGDYIVAMGFRNGSGVLDALRILILTPPTGVSRAAFVGKVASIEGSEITLEEIKTGEEYDFTVKVASTTKVTASGEGKIISSRAANIKESDVVLVSGILSSELLSARRIHILSQSE